MSIRPAYLLPDTSSPLPRSMLQLTFFWGASCDKLLMSLLQARRGGQALV